MIQPHKLMNIFCFCFMACARPFDSFDKILKNYKFSIQNYYDSYQNQENIRMLVKANNKKKERNKNVHSMWRRYMLGFFFQFITIYTILIMVQFNSLLLHSMTQFGCIQHHTNMKVIRILRCNYCKCKDDRSIIGCSNYCFVVVFSCYGLLQLVDHSMHLFLLLPFFLKKK